MASNPLLSRILSLAAILMVVMALFVPYSPSLAASALKMSSGEDVLIAFLKIGGATPDFTAMAKEHPESKRIPVARKGEFLEKERQRLLHRWQSYNRELDTLYVRVPVRVALVTEYDESAGEPVTLYRMSLSLDQDKELFFPYIHAGYEIAVIPRHYESLMHQPLPQVQYELLRQSFGGKESGTALLWLNLKPISADTSQPYRMAGHDQWLLLTDIVGANLLSADGMTLWNHSAEGYVSAVTHELMDIYEESHRERAKEQREENPAMPASQP